MTDSLTVSVTTDSELDIAGDFNLDHGGLVVHKILDGDDDLVDIFAVDLLACLETLNHVVNELLGHLVAQSHTIISWLDSHRFQVETLGRGWFIANLDSSKESQLSHNLLAFFQLESSILVVGVEGDACLKIIDGVLGS